MPKMPNSYINNYFPGGKNMQNIGLATQNSTNVNVKLKLLEDKLEELLAPRNLLVLTELVNPTNDQYLYIFDPADQQLKKVSLQNLSKDTINYINNEIKDLSTEIGQTQTAVENTKDILQSDLHSLEVKHDTLETQLNKTADHIISTLNSNIAEVKKDLAISSSSIGELQLDIEDTDKKVDTTSNKVKMLDANLNDLALQVDNLVFLNYDIVSSLPNINQAVDNTIYLVKNTADNYYNEYLFSKQLNKYIEFNSSKLANIDINNYRTAKEQDLINVALQNLLLKKLQAHINDNNNPHHITKEQLGIDDSPELTFLNHYEFPNVGETGILYIATDEEAVYFWKENHYVSISAQNKQPDIKVISGGNANSCFDK